MKNMASNDLFLIVKSFILFVISQFPFVLAGRDIKGSMTLV